LPITIDSSYPSRYRNEQLTMYDQDNNQKIDYLSEKLSGANYIIFNSRRLYGTLIHLSDKYPIASRYYRLLFTQKLGYVEVAQFSSYPSLFGITINDDGSEETFQVYDHPKVIIFKNEKHLSKKQLEKILKDEKIIGNEN
jgi:hypothetical protein